MVAKTETEESNALDTVKLLAAVALLVAGIVQFYYFEGESLLYRVLGLLGFVALAGFVVYQTALGRNVWGFARDARAEVRKVIWPTRQETMQTTLMVVVVVFFMAILLWLIDMALRWGILQLTGQGG